MAFWKRKREEKREAPPPAAPEETYLGEVIVELEEREEGAIRGSTVELKSASRVLRVVNRSTIPVFSTEVIFGNADKVTLDERLFIKMLSAYGVEGYMFEKEYDVKKYRAPIKLTYEIVGPEESGGVLLYGFKNQSVLRLKVKPNTEGVVDEIVVEYYPSEDVISVAPRDNYEGRIVRHGESIHWVIEQCQPKTEYSCEFDLGIMPRNKERATLGKIRIKVRSQNTTFSSLYVKNATSQFLLNYDASKKERSDEPGVWDVTLIIRNPYNLRILAEGEIEVVSGELESVGEASFVERKGKKIIIKQPELEPNGSLSVGPIVIRSMEIPYIKARIGGSVEEKVSIRSEGLYELELPEIDVMSFDLEKEAKVIADKRLSKYLRPNEIPPIGDNHVEIATYIVNDGGVDIGAVEIHELIPTGLGDPTKISLKIGGKVIREYEKEVTPVEGTEFEKKLIVRLAGEKVFPRGKKIELRYRSALQKVSKDTKELRFPTKVLCGATPTARKLEKELPTEKTPVIRVVRIARAIDVSRHVIPLGEDIFELRITVRNSGETPAFDYEVKYVIPKTFEVLEVSPEATRTESEKGVLLSWKISLEPKESKDLIVKVKGVGEYVVSELLQVESI